ncbi:GNAT family N-acetyltransferase [Rhizobium herbae]|uniref:RimJ/RimL family protein N-acetyltransferase n=1 Tax=Rhizobium herbae TaxID=508661 RepID=A0ABS4EJW1_9HYPH|nr:GNAT family protein [Rhizobium herbae]MBP1858235.1 RimJ/RimL family protein N-acetyltransferase [Rhizobium herbae]
MHPRLMMDPAPVDGAVVFRQPLDTDFGVLASLRRDPAVQSMLMAIPDATDDDAVRGWIDRRLRDSDGAFRVVADVRSHDPLGFVQISQVHRRNRHGYGGLALLSQARGRGLGLAIVTLLMKLASEELGLAKLLLEVRHDNLVALKVYHAAGFRVVGTLEEHFRDRDGKVHDVLLLERRLTPIKP